MNITCTIWKACIHKLFYVWFPLFKYGCQSLAKWCHDLQPRWATCLSSETVAIEWCDLWGRQLLAIKKTNLVKHDSSRFRRMLSQLKDRIFRWGKTYGALDRYCWVATSDCMFHKQTVQTCTQWWLYIDVMRKCWFISASLYALNTHQTQPW